MFDFGSLRDSGDEVMKFEGAENLRVSVVMCVWNGEKYLSEAINSILNQSLQNFEFIIVNDGSTDGTAEILNEFALQDHRIRILTNEQNRGQSYSKNLAVTLARGEYIAMMDADDWCDSLRLEKQIHYLDSNPAIDVLGTNYLMQKDDQSGSHLMETASLPGHLRWDFIFHCAICQASVMLRSKLFQKEGFRYDETFTTAADFELWTRIIQNHKISNLGEVLYYYRWHENNISIRRKTDQTNNIDFVVNRQVKEYINDVIPDPIIDGFKWPKRIRNYTDARRIISFYLKLLEASGSWNLSNEEAAAIFEDFNNKLRLAAKAVHKTPFVLISGKGWVTLIRHGFKYHCYNQVKKSAINSKKA